MPELSLKYAKEMRNKTGAINDPLGQTHSLASSEQCFSLEICFVLNSGTDGRTDELTNGRHVQKQWSLPEVTVGRPRGSISKTPQKG